MLHNTFLRTFYNIIFLFMSQKHPYNGRLWNDCSDFGQHFLIFFTVQNFLLESRSVIIVNLDNAFFHTLTATKGCINSQIATFGMTTQNQFVFSSSCCFFQIIYCIQLRWYTYHQPHIKILPPADDRVICTAEGYISRIFINFYRHGAELFL